MISTEISPVDCPLVSHAQGEVENYPASNEAGEYTL